MRENIYAKKVDKTNFIEIKMKNKIKKLKFTLPGHDTVFQSSCFKCSKIVINLYLK